MRILFIGKENLQNQAIIEILKSEDGFEVTHLLPIQVEEQSLETNPRKYEISLVDLTSFSYSPDVSIKVIKGSNLAHFVVALHTYTNKKLIQPILDAGTDHYLPFDSGTNDLLKIINDLSASSV